MQVAERIGVLVVDDSAICRAALRAALSSDPELEVVGEARDGVEACRRVEELDPALVTLDLQMPKMGGLETIDWIMKHRPRPILIITDRPRVEGVDMSFACLSRGALELLPKTGAWVPGTAEATALVAKVKALVRSTRAPKAVAEPRPARPAKRPADWDPVVLLLGASTGGPSALATVLKALPKPFPLPIVLVQHMDALFHDRFMVWLGRQCGMRVRSAEQGEVPVAGEVTVAAPGQDLRFGAGGRLERVAPPPGAYHVPSVDTLFHSAAAVVGARAIAVVLTGMGNDGGSGLAALHAAGAMTLVQDRASSVIWGMPGAAVERGAAEYVLSLEGIAKEVSGALPQAKRVAMNEAVSAGAGAPRMTAVTKHKILMVDDSPVILEAGRMALEDAGFDVVTLDNPLTVANAVRRERPDLVMIDVNMPSCTGDMVIQIVNQHGLMGKTRVVLYSDIPEADLEARAKRCGANGYIRKTGDEDAMISQVRGFLGA